MGYNYYCPHSSPGLYDTWCFRTVGQGDLDVISSDNIRHTVRWGGSDDVSSLQGQTILLKFYLTNCKLYSFVFKPGS